ncbi:MAG TPA: hypothetical protein VFQ30_12625 [Ktedonobacteraceae bacterium]|nr:hypothetical protein [Ktedonobacteraceae bacterium]
MSENTSAYIPVDGEDDNGYDVPFGTFTWARWQEMQAQTLQRFTRFQRAIERKKPHEAALIALELQEMAAQWLKEACCWMEIS